MIIDRAQLAGSRAYFKGSNSRINLAGWPNSRTRSLGKGKQLEISAIELLIESDSDLRDLFKFDRDPPAHPLFSITVMKEMFPRVFADPFAHRVHNISGFDDLKRGTLRNGRVMDIDGVPTIVSVGTDTCVWKSPLYSLPDPATFTRACWDLAASTQTPAENFTYAFRFDQLDANTNVVQSVYFTNTGDTTLPSPFNPTEPRQAVKFEVMDVEFYQIEFRADVKRDAALYEKHTTLVGESIGTPLLRAINLLEPVESIYKIHSLQELLSLCSKYHLFESPGQPLTRMLATLNLPATLVYSEYQDIQHGQFESVKLAVSDAFSNVEAKLIAELLVKPDVM